MNDKHKYSTFILFGLIALAVFVAVLGLDGSGTMNYIPKFLNGEFVINSSLVDDMPNGTSINISKICTSDNNLCVSNGSSSIISGNGTLTKILNGTIGSGEFIEWYI